MEKENAIECKICGANAVKEFIDYGKQPMGNLVLKIQNPTNEYFLDMKLGFCENCKLVQQINLPDYKKMQEMYDEFAYIPFGQSLRNNLTELGRSVYEQFKPKFVLDIGSNDGTLLEPIKDSCKVLGVEPAKAISEIAKGKGVDTINDYFTDSIANRIVSEYGKADVITNTQVLQHIPDIKSFLKNVNMVLAEDGTFVVECRDFAETLKQTSYDTVYAETVWLFTLTSIKNVLEMFGLFIYDAKVVEAYGGSVLIYASKSKRPQTKMFLDILKEEEDMAIGSVDKYIAFGSGSYRLRDELKSLVNGLVAEGKPIAAYGASATSTTMLNFCKFDNKGIIFIIDESKLKQGHFTSGTHIPIVGLDYLNENKPDYVLLTAWRLKKEISPKIPDGVGIIIPLPEVGTN